MLPSADTKLTTHLRSPNNCAEADGFAARLARHVLRRNGKEFSVPRTMMYSDRRHSDPRSRRDLRVKPGAGNAEPKRRDASPGWSPPNPPALKGRNPDWSDRFA
jgi:hypothetical protein